MKMQSVLMVGGFLALAACGAKDEKKSISSPTGKPAEMKTLSGSEIGQKLLSAMWCDKYVEGEPAREKIESLFFNEDGEFFTQVNSVEEDGKVGKKTGEGQGTWDIKEGRLIMEVIEGGQKSTMDAQVVFDTEEDKECFEIKDRNLNGEPAEEGANAARNRKCRCEI